MKAYLVLDITVTDMRPFLEYAEKIPQLISRHDGKYIVQGAAPEVIEGDWAPERLIIMEFPSQARAQDFLNDKDCQSLFPKRHASTISKLVLVDGCT